MSPITVQLNQIVSGTTATRAKIVSGPSEMEILLPDFKIIRSENFDVTEQVNILCKLGKHKENLMILAQSQCSIDL